MHTDKLGQAKPLATGDDVSDANPLPEAQTGTFAMDDRPGQVIMNLEDVDDVMSKRTQEFAGMFDGSWFNKSTEDAFPSSNDRFQWYFSEGIDNLAGYMFEEALMFGGSRAIEHYNIDHQSMSSWRDQAKRGLDMMDMKGSGRVDQDFKAKYPLVAQGVVQFAARAGSALYSDPLVVTASVMGADPDGSKAEIATEISHMMSHQIMELDENFVDDTDKLLTHLGACGHAYRKRVFNGQTGLIESNFLTGFQVVVNNQIDRLSRAPRISEVFSLYAHEVRQKTKMGYFHNVDIHAAGADIDPLQEVEFIEQHTWLDIMGNGWDEPYIITVQKDTMRIVRVVPGFTKKGYLIGDTYTDSEGQVTDIISFDQLQLYSFARLIPDPEGGFMGNGFGYLLGPTNETINDILSSIVDAADLYTKNGGIIGSGGAIGLNTDAVDLEPGKMNILDVDAGAIKENMFMFPHKEPSTVMFSILGLLSDGGKELTSLTDMMLGQGSGNMPATTAMAIVEQGMELHTSLQTRFLAFCTRDFKVHEKLVKTFMVGRGGVKYNFAKKNGTVGDVELLANHKITVTADPKMSTKMHKAQLAGILKEFVPDPEMNGRVLKTRIFKLMGVQDVDELFAPKPEGPDPMLVMEQDKIEIEKVKNKLKGEELQIKRMHVSGQVGKLMAEIEKIKSEVNLSTGQFEGKDFASRLSALQATVSQFNLETDNETRANEFKQTHELSVSQVEGAKRDASAAAASKGKAASKNK